MTELDPLSCETIGYQIHTNRELGKMLGYEDWQCDIWIANWLVRRAQDADKGRPS